jgi:hypothetical protein
VLVGKLCRALDFFPCGFAAGVLGLQSIDDISLSLFPHDQEVWVRIFEDAVFVGNADGRRVSMPAWASGSPAVNCVLRIGCRFVCGNNPTAAAPFVWLLDVHIGRYSVKVGHLKCLIYANRQGYSER